jgi:DNA-binding SARP family transcriptional activator
MRFLLLGHFEIEKPDGRTVGITRVKHRQLLALLLLDAPQVVSTERCIRGLWGERSPASARRNLQTYIAGLRQALVGSRVRIETVPGGYRITGLGCDGLDVADFESLRRQAALALTSVQDATEMLGAAPRPAWRGGAVWARCRSLRSGRFSPE